VDEALDSQRAYYEDGRITIDRVMDAISQYTTAVATGAQHLSNYNTALAALSEAKGTLLVDRNIVVEDGCQHRTEDDHARADQQAKTASFEPDKTSDTEVSRPKPTPSAALKIGTASCATGSGATCCRAETNPARTETSAARKTWKFTISIGGSLPLQVEGNVSLDESAKPVAPGR
jgi:hypothetical protein